MALSIEAKGSIARRHDLDALRAIAMLLGIALHVALGYTPGWIITDDVNPRMLHQTTDSFRMMFEIIHGFRMPLFFLVSGFFTAMLWRKRGLDSLLKHRYARIFLPCMLGLIFIQSMEDAVGRWRGDHDRKLWEEARPEMTLHDAAWRSDRRVLDEILKEGADVNEQHTEDGYTPLMVVTQLRRQDLVEMLVRRGADTTLTGKDGKTAEIIAEEVGHEGIVEFFEREKRVHSMTIWDAVQQPDRRIMHRRLDIDPDSVIQLHPETGETPLQLAIASDDWERVADLFDRGADVNVKNGQGQRPIEWVKDSENPQLKYYLQLASDQRKLGDGTRQAGGHFFERIRAHDTGRLIRLIKSGVDPNSVFDRYGYSALSYAVATGKYGVAEMLLNHGADVNGRNRDGNTALHVAALFARHGEIRLLKRFEVDTSLKNDAGETAADVAATPFTVESRDGLMYLVASLEMGINPEAVKGRRYEAAKILGTEVKPGPSHEEVFANWNQDDFWRKYKSKNENREDEQQRGEADGRGEIGKFKDWYWKQVNEARHYKNDEGQWQNLFHQGGFGHFWFLWFLVWLVALFAIYALVCDLIGLKRLPKWLIVSQVRYLYLIPLTLIPTLVMHSQFGPDTSTHWGPQPHMLVYYLIFFLFGAWYFDVDDNAGKLGRFWWITIPLSILLYLACGRQEGWLLEWLENQPFFESAIEHQWLQLEPYAARELVIKIASVTYVWMMTFGWMGCFRTILSRESKVMRYVSDSSYWLYVAHMPLVGLYIQLVKPMDWHPWIKFTVVCTAITVTLLITYQLFVRHTPIGWLLNGKRKPKVKPE